MTKRELVTKVFRGESVERVPVGFWFHYAGDELVDVFKHLELRDINIQGHEKYFREFQPDFLKIMTDGYFIYPNEIFNTASDAGELWKVKSIGKDHPWIREQIRFAREITAKYSSEVLTFYNVFSPATIFKFARKEAQKDADTILADCMIQDREAVSHAFAVVAGDLAFLVQGVTGEGGADGIYYSVQDVADSRISAGDQRACTAQADFTVLGAANNAGKFSILHICSYAGHHNDVSRYTSYPAGIINWAAHLEKLPLGEGKKLFGGKPVIGGFDNTVKGVLYRGSKEEIEAETRRLLEESGRTGVILGADCTIPRDISLDHLRWVRAAAG
jgi:uroporphyrinogen decarboxylase